MTKVLVVDDEIPLTRIITSYLDREGFICAVAHDGPAAVSTAKEFAPDLIVLDVMLPGFDGVEVCRQVRQFSDAYIIMLTARDEETDKIVALSMGADDYVVKPFSPRELVARAKAMLRRPRFVESHSPIHVSGLHIDSVARIITIDGSEVELTRTEFDLLAALASHPQAAFTRRQLLDKVWGPGWIGDEHVVDVHIGHLRSKIGEERIRTVRGVGYGMGRS